MTPEQIKEAVYELEESPDRATITLCLAALAYADLLATGKKAVAVREGWEPCPIGHPFPVESPSLCIGCDGSGWRLLYGPKEHDAESV